MEETLKINSLEDAMFNDDMKQPDPAPQPPVENKFETPKLEEVPVEESLESPAGETPVDEAPVREVPIEHPENVEIVPISEAPEPVIQEKIVEKPIEFKDEHAEKLYTAITEGGEEAEKALLNYLSSKHKDYTSMDTLSVLKEKIRAEKPHWDSEDVNAEVEARYGEEKLEKIDISLIDEDETDKIERAERFNKEVDRLLRLRERDAKDARIFLESQKQNIELPSIKKEVAPAPQKTQAEIDAENQAWNLNVETQMKDFSDLRFNAGNEEIVYKLTDEERAKQVEYMKNASLPDLLKDLGWLKEDGTDDILKIAKDVQLLKDQKKIFASISTQMKTSAKKEIVAKDIKNIDFNDNVRSAEAPKQDAGDYILSL